MVKYLKYIMLLLAMVVSMPTMAQNAASEPRAVKGGNIVITFKNIPAEDNSNVTGEYIVNRGDGTISLPYLSGNIYVLGKTARDIENIVENQYKAQQIYSDPIVEVRVGPKNEIGSVEVRYILVSGYVNQKKNLPYREGITLLEALLDCGDISDYGSRKIKVTRGKDTRTYDYFSARDRGIKLLPSDVIYVPRRGPFESRPSNLEP